MAELQTDSEAEFENNVHMQEIAVMLHGLDCDSFETELDSVVRQTAPIRQHTACLAQESDLMGLQI